MLDIKYQLHSKWNQLYRVEPPSGLVGYCFLIQVISRQFDQSGNCINKHVDDEFVFRRYKLHEEDEVIHHRYDFERHREFKMLGIGGGSPMAEVEFDLWLEDNKLERNT